MLNKPELIKIVIFFLKIKLYLYIFLNCKPFLLIYSIVLDIFNRLFEDMTN